MTSRYHLLLPATLACLLLAACTDPAPQPTPSTPPATPVASSAPTPTGTPDPAAAAAATALVRAGATEPTPIGSAPITANTELKGGTLTVFSVRTTTNSTRLEWIITHPTLTGLPETLFERERDPWLPYLVSGDTSYRTTQQRVDQHTWVTGVLGNQYLMSSVPHPMFSMYAPLPPETTTIEVHSALISQPITVPVTRGPEPLPTDTPEVPIKGRAVYGNTADPTAPDPLIVTLHGVRRLDNATAVYYSAAFPQGATPRNFEKWGGGSNVLNKQRRLGEPFTHGFGLVDRTAMTGYTQVGTANVKQGCNFLEFPKSITDNARVCWALFPPLPTSSTTIDVIIGGQMLIQDAPIETGPMQPTSPEKFPLLGTGWPTIPAKSLEVVTPEANERATSAIRDVITEKAITTSGTQLDLDATVLFNYNEATLTPAATDTITTTANKIRALNKPGTITIIGHTDSDGPDDFNLDLSKRRAQTVANALQPLLGPTYTLTAEGRGETEPTTPNTTEQGKAMNRRVTILPPQ